MKSGTYIKSILLLTCLLGYCIISFASNEKPALYNSRSWLIVMPLVTDTVPPPATTNATKEEKPAGTITLVKEVPKARKQPIPVPVTVQIKPIKVIKPKIVKPGVKIL